MPEPTRVVFDVNVLVNAMIGPDSSYPVFTELPPTTGNPAADCLSLIFDADEFALFTSPHILRNTLRVLVEKTRVSQGAAAKYIDALTEIVEYSGGAIIDPPRTVHEVHDFEDNLILDLVVDVDALILVTDDTDLTELSPWRGRPLLRPRTFVERAVASRKRRAANIAKPRPVKQPSEPDATPGRD
ncbi:MAG: PIN domain-containing protein [Rhodoglobus sp.]